MTQGLFPLREGQLVDAMLEFNKFFDSIVSLRTNLSLSHFEAQLEGGTPFNSSVIVLVDVREVTDSCHSRSRPARRIKRLVSDTTRENQTKFSTVLGILNKDEHCTRKL